MIESFNTMDKVELVLVMFLFLLTPFLIAYLVGSIPFGLILTKIFLKKDVRKIGSKSIGATNVLRTGSKTLAILTVILDGCKPFFACLIISLLFGSYSLSYKMAIVGVTIFAHCFPVYLKFKGGKGVATVFGSLFLFSSQYQFLGIGWYVLPQTAFITWLIVAFVSKKSSLAAVVTAFVIPVYVYFLNPYSAEDSKSLTIFYVGVSIFVLFRHTANIKRLIKGEESNIKLSKEKNVK